jgi:hypothetical protein
LEAVLDRAGLPGPVVTTDGRTPREVAAETLAVWRGRK